MSSAYDRGFTAGLLVAANMAREAARLLGNKDVACEIAATTLETIADEYGRLATPPQAPSPPDAPAPVPPPPRPPTAPAAAAARPQAVA